MPSLEPAPQESARTLWAPSPAVTVSRATGPAPWATLVKVGNPPPQGKHRRNTVDQPRLYEKEQELLIKPRMGAEDSYSYPLPESSQESG